MLTHHQVVNASMQGGSEGRSTTRWLVAFARIRWMDAIQAHTACIHCMHVLMRIHAYCTVGVQSVVVHKLISLAEL